MTAPTITLTLPDISPQLEAACARLARQFTLLRELNALTTHTLDVETRTDDYQHDFTAEIEAGVALLDTHLGRETWLPRVNLSTLQLHNALQCVLAQTTGRDYFEATASVGNPDVDDVDWGDAYGFAVSDELAVKHGEMTLYRQLTDQWVRKIAALRAEVSA